MERLLAVLLAVTLSAITLGCAPNSSPTTPLVIAEQPRTSPSTTPTPPPPSLPPTPKQIEPAVATPAQPVPPQKVPAAAIPTTPPIVSPPPVTPITAQPATPTATQPHVFRLVEPDGTELVLEQIPRRIVALSVNTAGVLASMGIMPVGMATTSRAPQTLRHVPQIGAPRSPDMERLRALAPDLVIANVLFKPTLGPIFRQHGVTAYFIDNQRYSDVISNLEMFGRAFFNNSNHAQNLIDHIRGRERAVLANIAGRNTERVVIIHGTPQSFMLSTQYSYPGEMVAMLGGRNVTLDMPVTRNTQQIPISMENIAAFNPQLILRVSHGAPAEVAQMFATEFIQNPIWGRLDAVRNNRVIDLPADLFMSNPGLLMIDAFEFLARAMYP